jgi:hypothetical protein
MPLVDSSTVLIVTCEGDTFVTVTVGSYQVSPMSCRLVLTEIVRLLGLAVAVEALTLSRCYSFTNRHSAVAHGAAHDQKKSRQRREFNRSSQTPDPRPSRIHREDSSHYICRKIAISLMDGVLSVIECSRQLSFGT